MKFDFDKVVDRHGTKCLKYDFAKERGRSDDMLPLWVADMDFPTAPGIQKSLSDAVAHGIYGYSEGKEDYFQAAAGWYEKHFGWKVEKEWLIKTPGVVFALAMAVKAYTKEGDAVLLQQPDQFRGGCCGHIFFFDHSPCTRVCSTVPGIDHHAVRRITDLRTEFFTGDAFRWLSCLQSQRCMPE